MLLQGLDQAGLAIAGWWLCEVLLRAYCLEFYPFARIQWRQHLFVAIAGLSVIHALKIYGHEAWIGDGGTGGTGGPKQVALTAGKISGHGVNGRMDQQAGDGTFPYQFIQTVLVFAEMGLQLVWGVANGGGANSLVRLLGVLGLGFIEPGLLG